MGGPGRAAPVHAPIPGQGGSRYEQSLLSKQQKEPPQSKLRMQPAASRNPANNTSGNMYGQFHEPYLPPTSNPTLNRTIERQQQEYEEKQARAHPSMQTGGNGLNIPGAHLQKRHIPLEQRLSYKKYDSARNKDPFNGTSTVGAKASKANGVVGGSIGGGLGGRANGGVNNSPFAREYERGSIPCRVMHMGTKCEVQWDIDLTNMPRGTDAWELLSTMSLGLSEMSHPFSLLGREGFNDVCRLAGPNLKAALQQDKGKERTLKNISLNLRKALMGEGLTDKASKMTTFSNGLRAAAALAGALEESVVPMLATFLPPISKFYTSPPGATVKEKERIRSEIDNCLCSIIDSAGDLAQKTIKTKIPNFN